MVKCCLNMDKLSDRGFYEPAKSQSLLYPDFQSYTAAPDDIRAANFTGGSERLTGFARPLELLLPVSTVSLEGA
jgi:hypothetical protein